MVDDHPLDYFDFEGIIPAAHYGAGAVVAWDTGSYELLEGNDPIQSLERGKFVIELHGKTLRGAFALVKMKGQGAKNWLLIKKKDRYSNDKWVLIPALTEQRKRGLIEKDPLCEVY
jgi:bifunctional non-homologous end joining protein LigD